MTFRDLPFTSETKHLHARERAFALEWEALDVNHGARYYRATDASEEDLARLAARGSRVLRTNEDPLKVLWGLE